MILTAGPASRPRIQAIHPGSFESKTFFGDQRGWVGLVGLGGGPLLFVAAEQPIIICGRRTTGGSGGKTDAKLTHLLHSIHTGPPPKKRQKQKKN